MDSNNKETYYNLKGFFKYVYTIISWTLFLILIVIGLLLIYYYISIRLYSTRGEKFEPKFSVYTIVSGSMEPTISVYDIIVNTKVNKIEDVKVNDVITFISTWDINNGMTVTHRVVGTKKLDDGSTCLITRGDNNTQEDPSCVKKSNLIGITKAVVPGIGKIQLYLANRFVWLLVIIVPAIYIIIKDVVKIFNISNELKSTDDKKDKNEIDDSSDLGI